MIMMFQNVEIKGSYMSLFLFCFLFFLSLSNQQIPLEQMSMLLFYINCMYKSIKSSYKASFRVEIVFG